MTNPSKVATRDLLNDLVKLIEHLDDLSVAHDADIVEGSIANALTYFTGEAMKLKMRTHHKENGRGDWWKPSCPAAELQHYLKKAVDDGDWISVMNYAAMIAAKEHMQCQPK